MHRAHHKMTRRILSGVVSCIFFIQGVLPASAFSLFGGGLKMPSASSVAGDIEQRYNVNTEAVREQGQQFNVMNLKKNAPEVTIQFTPTDPVVGEKITAIALPTFFTTSEDMLYYTWYIKRSGCNLSNSPAAAVIEQCDRNNDSKITVEDWKIEAMRSISSNDFDGPVDYAANGLVDNDNDGFRAPYGSGDNLRSKTDYCYYQDSVNGTFYEIAEGGDITFRYTSGGNPVDCTAKPVCLITNVTVSPGTIDAEATGGDGGSGGGSGTGGSGGTGGDASVSGDTFVTGSADNALAGFPTCSGGTPSCYVGTPACVTDTLNVSGGGPVLTSCEASNRSDAEPMCKHLFPNAPGAVTGNGSFNLQEENFWQTDPNDPSTASNGNKDEANVAGLGQSRFRWNYAAGDMVGVVVEGISMNPTKHADASGMIMWAFSKKNCPMSEASGTGEYRQKIKGYDVTFPTINIDLNKCLERNLIDPTVGGQATNLELHLASTPDLPQNDGTGRDDGDTVEVTATIDNLAKNLTETFFDWRVELSSNGTANPTTGWVNITSSLNALSDDRKLLSLVRGNGVNTVRLKLNLRDGDLFAGRALATYLDGNKNGYLRFRLDAAENFEASGVTRKGRSSVIIRFSSSTEKIHAYLVDVEKIPSGTGSVARLGRSDTEICLGGNVAAPPAADPEAAAKQALDKLEAKVCRVLKNEIIAVELDNPIDAATGKETYSNFSWTVNGKPLICNVKVSPQCFDDRQGNIAFFPVMGEVGDSLTISVTANKIAARTSTNESISLSRLFRITDPSVEIISGDETLVWPKVLGQYRDADGNAFLDESKDTFQALPDSSVKLRAKFIPDFLGNLDVPTDARWPKVELSWKVDDTELGGSGTKEIIFDTQKPAGSVYNVVLNAVYRPTDASRKALADIWGISVFDASEQYFGASIQLEHPSEDLLDQQQGTKKYLALLSNYLPASVLFGLRMLLSVAFILFVAGLVMAWLPNTQPSTRIFSRGKSFRN